MINKRREFLIYGGASLFLLNFPVLGRSSPAIKTQGKRAVNLFQFLTDYQINDVKSGAMTLDLTKVIQNAFIVSAEAGVKLIINKGSWRCDGPLVTRSNLHVDCEIGACLYPHKWSRTGAFIGNIDPDDFRSSYKNSIQKNIVIENMQIDGQFLPYGTLGNSNAIGFARGVYGILIKNCIVKNVKFNWLGGHGAGGKAVNYESGVFNSSVIGLRAINCGIALFVQGMAGWHINGEKKSTTAIELDDIYAENCEAAFGAFGINIDSDPDGDMRSMQVNVGSIDFVNCGHAPNRRANDPQKSGPIVFGEAQNVRIRSISGRNYAEYPNSYPMDGVSVGTGLSGPVGAAVWGWGQNITIDNFKFIGNCDSLVRINRARALGDDAGPSGRPKSSHNFNVLNIKHTGATDYILSLDKNRARRIDPVDLSGNISATTDILNAGFCDASLKGYNQIIINAVDSATGQSLVDSASNLLSQGNSYSRL